MGLAVPVAAVGDDPLAADERRVLRADAEAGGLVAEHAVPHVDAAAQLVGRERSGVDLGGRRAVRGEDVGAEAAAVHCEVKTAPKDEQHDAGDEPQRHALAAFGGIVVLAKDRAMHALEVDFAAVRRIAELAHGAASASGRGSLRRSESR